MYITVLILYILSGIAAVGGAYGVRELKFTKKLENNLDQILLLVSLVGVYVFSVSGSIAGYFRIETPLGGLVFVTGVVGLIQSTVQTVFILNGLRRSAANEDHVNTKPGRQYTTFLVVTNVALWAVNSFEVLRADNTPVGMDFYGIIPWSLITHISVPLAIFYRYHSTVCLADIWKDAYKIKGVHHGHNE